MALLFPLRCAACGKMRQGPEAKTTESPTDRPSMGAVLCRACRLEFTPVTSPLCPCCGKMFTSREGGDHLCAACVTTRKPYSRARAAGVYQGPLRALIQKFKFAGRTSLARPLGALAFDTFLRHWGAGGIDLVLPVPLHRRRMRRRGFNQAWLLIRDWPERYRRIRGAEDGITLCPRALIRHRRTPPQTGLDGKHRRRNIRGAFGVTDAPAIDGKRILLVDDVYTTGATVGECARVLMAAGASQVDILALARTMEPRTARWPEAIARKELAGD